MEDSTTKDFNHGYRTHEDMILSHNVDMNDAPNQMSLSSEDARLLEAHALPGSLVTYTDRKLTDFDKLKLKDRSGRILPSSDLKKEMRIPLSSGSFPSLFTQIDKNMNLKHVHIRSPQTYPLRTSELSKKIRNSYANKFLETRQEEQEQALPQHDGDIKEETTGPALKYFEKLSNEETLFKDAKETYKDSSKPLALTHQVKSDTNIQTRKLESYPTFERTPKVIPEAMQLSKMRVANYKSEAGVRAVWHWVSSTEDYDGSLEIIDNELKTIREMYDSANAEKQLHDRKTSISDIVETHVDSDESRDLMRNTLEKEGLHLYVITDSEQKFSEIRQQHLKDGRYFGVSRVDPQKNSLLPVWEKTAFFVDFTRKDLSDSKRAEEAFELLSRLDVNSKGLHSSRLTIEVSAELELHIIKPLLREVDIIFDSQTSPNEVVLRRGNDRNSVRIDCQTKQIYRGKVPLGTWVIMKKGKFYINNKGCTDKTVEKELRKFLPDRVPDDDVIFVKKHNPMENTYTKTLKPKPDKYVIISLPNRQHQPGTGGGDAVSKATENTYKKYERKVGKDNVCALKLGRGFETETRFKSGTKVLNSEVNVIFIGHGGAKGDFFKDYSSSDIIGALKKKLKMKGSMKELRLISCNPDAYGHEHDQNAAVDNRKKLMIELFEKFRSEGFELQKLYGIAAPFVALGENGEKLYQVDGRLRGSNDAMVCELNKEGEPDVNFKEPKRNNLASNSLDGASGRLGTEPKTDRPRENLLAHQAVEALKDDTTDQLKVLKPNVDGKQSRKPKVSKKVKSFFKAAGNKMQALSGLLDIYSFGQTVHFLLTAERCDINKTTEKLCEARITLATLGLTQQIAEVVHSPISTKSIRVGKATKSIRVGKATKSIRVSPGKWIKSSIKSLKKLGKSGVKSALKFGRTIIKSPGKLIPVFGTLLDFGGIALDSIDLHQAIKEGNKKKIIQSAVNLSFSVAGAIAGIIAMAFPPAAPVTVLISLIGAAVSFLMDHKERLELHKKYTIQAKEAAEIMFELASMYAPNDTYHCNQSNNTADALFMNFGNVVLEKVDFGKRTLKLGSDYLCPTFVYSDWTSKKIRSYFSVECVERKPLSIREGLGIKSVRNFSCSPQILFLNLRPAIVYRYSYASYAPLYETHQDFTDRGVKVGRLLEKYYGSRFRYEYRYGCDDENDYSADCIFAHAGRDYHIINGFYVDHFAGTTVDIVLVPSIKHLVFPVTETYSYDVMRYNVSGKSESVHTLDAQGKMDVWLSNQDNRGTVTWVVNVNVSAVEVDCGELKYDHVYQGKFFNFSLNDFPGITFNRLSFMGDRYVFIYQGKFFNISWDAFPGMFFDRSLLKRRMAFYVDMHTRRRLYTKFTNVDTIHGCVFNTSNVNSRETFGSKIISTSTTYNTILLRDKNAGLFHVNLTEGVLYFIEIQASEYRNEQSLINLLKQYTSSEKFRLVADLIIIRDASFVQANCKLPRAYYHSGFNSLFYTTLSNNTCYSSVDDRNEIEHQLGPFMYFKNINVSLLWRVRLPGTFNLDTVYFLHCSAEHTEEIRIVAQANNGTFMNIEQQFKHPADGSPVRVAYEIHGKELRLVAINTSSSHILPLLEVCSKYSTRRGSADVQHLNFYGAYVVKSAVVKINYGKDLKDAVWANMSNSEHNIIVPNINQTCAEIQLSLQKTDTATPLYYFTCRLQTGETQVYIQLRNETAIRLLETGNVWTDGVNIYTEEDKGQIMTINRGDPELDEPETMSCLAATAFTKLHLNSSLRNSTLEDIMFSLSQEHSCVESLISILFDDSKIWYSFEAAIMTVAHPSLLVQSLTFLGFSTDFQFAWLFDETRKELYLQPVLSEAEALSFLLGTTNVTAFRSGIPTATLTVAGLSAATYRHGNVIALTETGLQLMVDRVGTLKLIAVTDYWWLVNGQDLGELARVVEKYQHDEVIFVETSKAQQNEKHTVQKRSLPSIAITLSDQYFHVKARRLIFVPLLSEPMLYLGYNNMTGVTFFYAASLKQVIEVKANGSYSVCMSATVAQRFPEVILLELNNASDTPVRAPVMDNVDTLVLSASSDTASFILGETEWETYNTVFLPDVINPKRIILHVDMNPCEFVVVIEGEDAILVDYFYGKRVVIKEARVKEKEGLINVYTCGQEVRFFPHEEIPMWRFVVYIVSGILSTLIFIATAAACCVVRRKGKERNCKQRTSDTFLVNPCQPTPGTITVTSIELQSISGDTTVANDKSGAKSEDALLKGNEDSELQPPQWDVTARDGELATNSDGASSEADVASERKPLQPETWVIKQACHYEEEAEKKQAHAELNQARAAKHEPGCNIHSKNICDCTIYVELDNEELC